jgi:hypothetical protein
MSLDAGAQRAAVGASQSLPTWALWGTGGLTCAVWAAAVWTSAHVHADHTLHKAALFVHLACLVLGFGAVLALDWWGLHWLLGRRTLADVVRLAEGLHLLIWVGLAGLTLSGMLLNPDLSSPLTRIKLGLVLLIALNGLQAHALQWRLDANLENPPNRRLLVRSAASAGISQACWWGCMVIGFLNSTA